MRILCHPPLDLSSFIADECCFGLASPLLGASAIDAIIQMVYQHDIHALIISTKSCDVAMLMERLKTHFGTHAKPALLVTHSDDRLAYRAWLLGADGYLTEPVELDALMAMLAKIATPTLAQLAKTQPTPACTISTDDGLKRILLDDIYCITAEQKYSKIKHKHGTHLVNHTLKQLVEQYPDHLIRIHRNAIINPKYITHLVSDDGKSALHLGDPATDFWQVLAISRRQLADVRQRLKKL